MHIDGLDELDNRILNTIKNNARLSYSDIGEVVGLSRVAVKNRISIMEQAGIIKGYQTIIDETAASNSLVEFVLDISVNADKFKDVTDDLAKEPYIRRLCITSGRCKLMAFGFAPNTRTLSTYVDRLYYRMKGIEAISWQVMMSTLKDVDGGVEYERREELPDDKDNNGNITGC